MSEMVLVELPGGDWVSVRVPKGQGTSEFRDYVENELGMNTRGTVQVMTLAALRKAAG